MEIFSPLTPTTFSPSRRLLFFFRRRTAFPAPVVRPKPRWKCVTRSKSSDFQDFRGFAKPVRLLPATQVENWRKIADEEELKFKSVDGSQSLYRVRVRTSRAYGSGLSDINAAVLLCFIDEIGDSIMQRISALSTTGSSSSSSSSSSYFDEQRDADGLRFQRGSVDELVFRGPKLGKHLSVWMGTESGQWRLAGFSLSAAHPCQDSLEELSSAEYKYRGYRYDFENEETLIGGSSYSSMIELKPHRVTETQGQDPMTLVAESFEETTPLSPLVSADESMREYSNLKLSLLLYDAVLISAGATITSFSGGENAALAFLTGGLGGFSYLLLLQRSVDELPAPSSISGSTIDEAFSRFRGPVSIIALTIAFSLLTLKYGSGEAPSSFTPKDLILGMMGFQVCKVAVVLAAFKPISMRPKPND
ncbi:hypothetical protein MLD38_025401 [Melastoma candidum]|uniref:Uncharacterized protein n=1 Tax=Melastoma candidum TaxID=119954 RepID=A0ACB9NWV0_9MYRT|nr:hypothetical protein MLD38_025401 [Melastoma candidum]